MRGGSNKKKSVNHQPREEMDYFSQVEPALKKRGLTGHYVVVHAKEILAEGKTLDDAIKNLLVRFSSPPEPLLIRQVLGHRRTPIRMRSPKSVAGHTR
jgi:hypothetical protein